MSESQETNIWKVPGYTPTMVAIAAAFGAWSILLPVVPLAVIDSGGSATLAGGSTGIFMAFTVATQIMSPWLLRRWGYRRVMALSAFTLGVPAFGHLLGTDAWIVLLFSAMRGVGFGALTVSESALIAELSPVRLLGKATGMIGVFTGLGQMIFLPLGLFMADSLGYASTYITAGLIGFLGFAMCLRIPKIKVTLAEDNDEEVNIIRVPTWKLVLVPALALTTFSMSYGAISSFLSPAMQELDAAKGASLAGVMLSIVGGAAMIFRYFAGVVADRTGAPGSLYIPSQIMAIIGVGTISLTLFMESSIWWLVLGAVLFGGAFGIAQNEALLSMFDRLPRERVSEASAIWNIFYDSGTGLGSTLLGAMVAGYGYDGAFGAGVAILIAGLLLTTADFILGRTRISDTNDIRTRLRRMRKV
ncbi:MULTISPECIES: MFS transporter [unclassified Corynebacterium]|uniref:MFS transporter n=1 Tax=Corynebacterium TaxID=1716 RepID=UPI00254B3E23|nr:MULTISPECIES: MFS transporter [unclassified Corynebacterium]MDK8451950.1 MFS transporter [Corynebacterium sp. MSK084]MDK8475101.1 MFS transporter [Corynebacterium sp. MSK310]MDK8491104.1 MFS transporter [Corynebacterium sp. MSK175]MDK8513887.1 MFS transporter [Corynebacterium sp. MSK123]MDK8547365.1 MFS transporter [Corynebacterium sp. MSK222]